MEGSWNLHWNEARGRERGGRMEKHKDWLGQIPNKPAFQARDAKEQITIIATTKATTT